MWNNMKLYQVTVKYILGKDTYRERIKYILAEDEEMAEIKARKYALDNMDFEDFVYNVKLVDDEVL